MIPACSRNGALVASHLVTGLLLCFLLVASGCDVVAETIFLDRDAEFTFEFDGDAISPEGNVEALAKEDFDGRLDGFQKDEIVAATIVTARMERLSPAVNLDNIFSSVTLVLTNGQGQTVASQDVMPGQRQVPLDITQEGITSLVQAADGFGARLEAVAANGLDTTRDYRISVTLNISLEIEGI